MENEDLHDAMLELGVALGHPVLDAPAGSSLEAALIREAARRILQLPLVDWQRTRTIATLPNTKLTPQVVLARTLEKASHGKIKSVYIGLQWAANGHFTYDYSLMSLPDLSMHKLMLEYRLQNVAFASVEDETMNPTL